MACVAPNFIRTCEAAANIVPARTMYTDFTERRVWLWAGATELIITKSRKPKGLFRIAMFAATMVKVDRTKEVIADKGADTGAQPETSSNAKPAEPPRGFVAEWTVTIILLLFGTTTLVQAFVIPTGSMEDTLLVGDHLLVDKLAYAPGGSVTKNLLPYSEVHRGDIIVFRYPIDIKQTFVKRAMGVAGDRIRLENKKVFLNGHQLNEPYVVHKLDYIDSYRDNFPPTRIRRFIRPRRPCSSTT